VKCAAKLELRARIPRANPRHSPAGLRGRGLILVRAGARKGQTGIRRGCTVIDSR
jgi:hypothetical protein